LSVVGLQRFPTGAYKLENLGSFYGFFTAKNRLKRTVVGCELSVVGLQRFPTGAYKLENLGSFYGFFTAKNRLKRTVVGCELSVCRDFPLELKN
jgi:hypothetical protein